MIKKFYENPSNIFLFSSVIIFILILLPLYQVNYQFKFFNYVFVIICYLSAYLGLKFGLKNINHKIIFNKKINYSNIHKVYFFFVIISFIGIILTFYEFFIVRKISFGLNFTDNKYQWYTSNATILSSIAAGLQAFSVFLLPFNILIKKKNNENRYFYVSLILFLCYVFSHFLLGNRAPIIFAISFIFLFKLYFSDKFKIKYLILIFPLLVYISGLVFDIRLKSFDLKLFDSLYFSSYSFQVGPTSYYLDNQIYNNFFLTSLYSIYLYLIHGFYEILFLIENSTIFYDYGINLFWLPIKILNIYLNIDLYSNDIIRTGVYNTFISTFFRDFKFFSPIIIFFIFYILACPFKFLARGNINWLFICAVIFLFLLSSPFFSPFSSGTTSYLLVNSIIIRFILFFFTE